MNQTTYLFALAVSFSATSVLAEKNTPIDPKLGAVGSPTVSLDFAGELPESAVAAKGRWQIVDGVLVGRELASDKHAAVLNYQRENRDSLVRFSFKFDGNTEGMHFSLNHARGHLFRVIVTSGSLTINLDKDKKDPASKTVSIASAKGAFEQGKWYTMLIEMKGDRVVVQTDNGLSVLASHSLLDTVKPNYRFVMRGDSLSIDDLMIWDLSHP